MKFYKILISILCVSISAISYEIGSNSAFMKINDRCYSYKGRTYCDAKRYKCIDTIVSDEYVKKFADEIAFRREN